MGNRERGGGSASLSCGMGLAATAVSFLCLSGVRVERDGRVQEQQGRRSETNRVGTTGYTAKVRSQRSSEWKVKPEPAPPVHCVPLETNQATLCTRTADLCLVIYPLTMEK